MSIRRDNTKTTVGCGCWTIILAINLLVGWWSVVEILSWFGKSIPWFGAIIIGLIAGEVTLPIAIIGWILKVCGVF